MGSTEPTDGLGKASAAQNAVDFKDTAVKFRALSFELLARGDKLLQEIVFHAATECNQHLAEVDTKNKSALEKIEEIIRFHIGMMINNFEAYHVMTHEWIHLEEPHLSNFINQRRNYVQRLEAIIGEGIEDREMKPIIPYVAVLTILSAVRGLEFWHRSRKKYSPRQIEDNMVAHLIAGLRC